MELSKSVIGYITEQMTLFGKEEVIGFGSNSFKIQEITRQKACTIYR